MDADRIIDLLDTLTATDLRRVLTRAQELDQLYSTWQDPQYTAPGEPGSYVQEYVKCGKPGCKSCSELGGHGPYWYLYTSENGKTRKKYIGKNKP